METWLSKLQNWLKKLFRPKKNLSTSPKIIKTWYGSDCSVLQIRRDTPGVRATYRITSIHGQCDYLLTLDYLREMHTELVGEFQGAIIRVPTLDYQRNSVLTHRFAVWQLWRNGTTSPLGIWDVDLVSIGQNSSNSSSSSESAPLHAIRKVALTALIIRHLPQVTLYHWETQMEAINWILLLEKYIRDQLSNRHHNLKATTVLQDGL